MLFTWKKKKKLNKKKYSEKIEFIIEFQVPRVPLLNFEGDPGVSF